MQNPLLINKNLIDISLYNSHNNARIYFMNCDSDKIFFLKNLIENDVDYLLLIITLKQDSILYILIMPLLLIVRDCLKRNL